MKVSNKLNVKKIILAVMVMILSGFIFIPGDEIAIAAPNLSVEARGVVLMESKSGDFLYEKNADVPMAPASITKIMTCILVLENLNMDDKVVIPKEATNLRGNNINLKEGEVLTVRQLTNALMVYSANDAAVALAIKVSGNVNNFCKLMNKKALALGCKHTNYISPNGLTNNYNHITTARDQSLVARYFMKKQEAGNIVKQGTYTVDATNKSAPRKLKSTNEMLPGKKHEYSGTVGIKTGFMASSGYCFVGAAKRDDKDLIAVVLNESNSDKRFIDCGKIFDYGFLNYRNVELLKTGGSAGRVKVQYGNKTIVDTYVENGAYVTLANSDKSTIKKEISLNKNVKAPIKKGTKVGKVIIYKNGKKLRSENVRISETVKKGGPWSRFYISDRAFIAIVILVILIFLLRRKKPKTYRRGMKRAGRRRRG